MTRAADRIAAGLSDAIAWAEGDRSRARVASVPDVRAIRAATGLSQSAFAHALGLSPALIRDWEQRRRRPDAAARVLLRLADADFAGLAGMIHSSEGGSKA